MKKKKVMTKDGPRTVIDLDPDAEKREKDVLDYKAKRYNEISEWRFEIRMPEHLEKAGYVGGKGMGMNSWYFEVGDYRRIGYLDPEPMIECAQSHYEEIQKRFAGKAN